MHEDGVADASLQLTRSAPADGERRRAAAARPAAAFVRVERTLLLGLAWQVETRVVRLTPPDAALVLEVPLLPGEAVTTADVRVVDGQAQINLPPQAGRGERGSRRWPRPRRSRCARPRRSPWVEVWRLDASPIWHVEASGIPPVHAADADARRCASGGRGPASR